MTIDSIVVAIIIDQNHPPMLDAGTIQSTLEIEVKFCYF